MGTSILGSLTERDPEMAVGGAVATVSEEGEAGLRNKSFLTFTVSSCFCASLMRGGPKHRRSRTARVGRGRASVAGVDVGDGAVAAVSAA